MGITAQAKSIRSPRDNLILAFSSSISRGYNSVHNRVRFFSFLLLATIVFTALSVFGEGTRTWEQNKYDDFSKGTTHGVAISSNGFLLLAPAFKLLATTP